MSSKMPSQRQLRVGELLRQAVSETLARGELHDPVLSEISVTVSQVKVSPDLKNATVFVYPLGGANVEGVLEALKVHADELRRIVGKKVQLRYAPRLHVKIDDSFDKASQVYDILRRPEVKRDLDDTI